MPIASRPSRALTLVMLAVVPAAARADFLNVPVPPDVDKAGLTNGLGTAGDDTCWLATASNLLASAGFGDGANVNARALGIYADLYAHFGVDGGKTQNALNWWLASPNNDQPTNPYRYVQVYGNTTTRKPYQNSGLKSQIINELRAGNRVGLSISWPEDKIFHAGGRGGHAIAAWGDDGNVANSTPVSGVFLTDSDSDPDLQFYAYDDYDNPNPSGPNGSEGKGWYINYQSAGDNAFIKNICVLRPVAYMPLPGLGEPVQYTRQLTGSLKLKQPYGNGALGLSYRIDSSGDIYDYHADQNHDPAVQPSRSPSLNPNQSLDSVLLDYDFSANPVPFGKTVTLTHSIVVADIVSPFVPDAQLEIKSPTWHYAGVDKSLFNMDLKAGLHPTHFEPDPAPDAPEGYIVTSFDLFGDPAAGGAADPLASYRFLVQYSAGASDFVLTLEGVRNEFTDGPLTVGNLRFGHSDGDLSDAELWDFADWLVTRDGTLALAAGVPLAERLGIDALLPRTLPESLPDDLRVVPEPAAALPLLAAAVTSLRRRRPRGTT